MSISCPYKLYDRQTQPKSEEGNKKFGNCYKSIKDSGEGQRENRVFFYLKVKIKPQKRVKEETINVSQEYRATEGKRETEGGKQTV